MKLSNRSIRIKELIQDEVCMGTYGIIELHLQDFDKEIERLKKVSDYWFDAVNDMDSDKANKMIDNQPR